MSLSTATVNPTQIPLTPMQVLFNNVDLGGTVEGVSLSVKYETSPIMVDQFGKTELDRKVSGQAYSVKCTFAQIQNMDIVAVILPSSHEVTGSSKSTYMDLQIGDSLLSHAQQLVLHPLEKAASDHTEDWLFYKAVCIGTTEVKYGPDKQSGMQAEFVIFPDTTSTPARFCLYGDPANGLVNAIAASAVAGSNVGNGNVSAVTPYNGYTKSETITLTCVGVPSAHKSNWYVSGSQSGPLGIAEITSSSTGGTVNFVSNPITFTIASSSVDFAVNDSFTIATTGANFT